MSAPLASALFVVLCGWLVRPRPSARPTRWRHRRPQRWVLVLPAAAAALLDPLLGMLVSAIVVLGRRYLRLRRRARTVRQVAADYPDALDLMVSAIRAGYIPAQAVVEIVPHLPASLRATFAAVEASMNNGARFADALQLLPATIGSLAHPLADSLASADRYGLPLAPVLERLAFEARQQRRRAADTAARELPVRLAVPLVLCTLPSFVLLAIVPLLFGALSSLHS